MLEQLRFNIMFLALFAGIFGLFFNYKLPNYKAKSLLCIIWLSFFVEVIGLNYTHWTGLKNYIVFNVYLLLVFNYYVVLIYHLLYKILYKKIAIVFFIFFNLIFLVNIFYFQNILEEMLTNCFAMGVIFVLILSCLYLIELFNSDRVLHFRKSIYFWFILGILLFYIPLLPIMVTIKLFIKVDTATMFSIVLFALNLLMYSCFIIGFIWSQKKYNY